MRQSCAWAGTAGSDPAERSAGVSAVQASFEGSDRQARGRLLAALSGGQLERGQAVWAMGLEGDEARAQRLVEALISEGLITAEGDQLRLG